MANFYSVCAIPWILNGSVCCMSEDDDGDDDANNGKYDHCKDDYGKDNHNKENPNKDNYFVFFGFLRPKFVVLVLLSAHFSLGIKLSPDLQVGLRDTYN